MIGTILRLAVAAMGIAFPAPAHKAGHVYPLGEGASRHARSAGQNEPSGFGDRRRAAVPVAGSLLDEEAATLNPQLGKF